MKQIKTTFIPLLIVLTTVGSSLASAELLKSTRPLPAGAFAASEEPQELTLLFSGAASFERRLQLIRSARQSIETEFYVFRDDQAGRLYTQALIERARAGVQVRILIDKGFANTNLTDYHAQALAEQGIEVRFYHEVSPVKIEQANHRSHRKSLIVDGIEAVVGGRNLAEEHFDFSPKFNLLDRDVDIRGSMVAAIKQSFENFWASSLTRKSQPVKEPQLADYGLQSENDVATEEGAQSQFQKYKKARTDFEIGTKRADSFLAVHPEDPETLKRIHQIGSQLLALAPKGICNETYYYADLPGHVKTSRVVLDQIQNLVSTAKETLRVESPFFVQNESGNLFEKALRRGVKVEILTNSLASAISPLTIPPMLQSAKTLTALGADVYVYEGVAPRWLEFPQAQAKTARWGTHGKNISIDQDTFLIGSFNMDPRSANWNAEMAFVCRGNARLTEGFQLDTERRKSIAVRLNQNGDPVDGRGKFFDASQKQMLMYDILKPFAFLFEGFL